MTKIIPVTDMRDTKMISNTITENPDEPIFVTKQGKGFLVIMSHDYYVAQKEALKVIKAEIDEKQTEINRLKELLKSKNIEF